MKPGGLCLVGVYLEVLLITTVCNIYMKTAEKQSKPF